MATRTTTKTTIKPTYVKNTNVKGTKTGVSNNSRGTKTTVVKNAAGTTYTKVTNAAGKTFTKATDSKGNVITPKVKAKAVVVAPAKITKTTVVTPKAKAVAPSQMDSIPFKNNAIAKFQGTPGKSYVITAPDNKRSPGYGTIEQADSAYSEKFKWNTPYRNAEGELFGKPTKQGYQTRPGDFSNYTKAQIAALPDYVPPKNTNKGPLKRVSDVSHSTGMGTCEPGYVLRNGRCVPR